MRPLARTICLVLLALFGLGLGLAVFAVPGWLAERVQTGLVTRAAKRGLDLRIGAVYLDPMSRLTLDSVTLADAATGTAAGAKPAAPFLRIARVQVDYEINGVLSPRVWLRKVTVDAPDLSAVRAADGKTNLEKTLRRLLASTPDDDEAAGGGGLRKYLSKHLPDLHVRRGKLSFDDLAAGGPAKVAGVDLRHLRITEASLEVRNVSPVQEVADLRCTAGARVAGVSQPVQASGELRLPKREGSVTVRLPGDMAVEVAGYRVSVGSATVHSDGRVALGRVQVAKSAALQDPSVGQLALDIQEVVAHIQRTPGPEPSLPPALRAKVPAAAWQALRYVARVSVHEPVLVGKRPVLAAPRDEAEADDEPPLPEVDGKLPVQAKREPKPAKAKLPVAKGKDGKKLPEVGDGHIVRENLAGLFANNAERLQRQLGRLREALGAIPIPVITIHHGRARYSDERQGPASELSDFNVRVERPPGQDVVTLQLDFNVPGHQGKTNSVSAKVDTKSGDAELKVMLEQLPIAPYAAVLPSNLTLEPQSAVQASDIHLTYQAAAGTMAIDGLLTIAKVHLDMRRLSRHRLMNLTATARGKLLLDLGKQELQIQEGELTVGKVTALVSSSIKRFRTAPAFDLKLKIPTVDCQEAVNSVPVGFAPMLDGLQCHGQMSFEVNGFLDTANMNTLKFDFDAALADVKITSTGKYIRFDIFGAPFEHHARQKDGSLFTFVTGPGSDRWVPMSGVSPYFIKVITTTEDGGFFGHSGFSLDSIRNAMIENLKRGRFVRGASTITQQLVKNLFFVEREKTISRKVQEAVITWQIERSLGKQEMMSLYLNIIEFGPRLYGIKAAAQHYFNRPAAELTLLQAIWLGSIIPNPRVFYHQFSKGAVGESWRTYLCWIAATMLTREKITEDEYRRLGGCNVVFGGGPDGSEAPTGEPGLGHEGDPSLGDPLEPGWAERPAPSVLPEDQP